jgi:toxin-antitoxin system PIN domain toxin
VIAVDTNLLVYAHREDSPWHEAAVGWLTGVAEGSEPWAIPWPCVHEFLSIVTHPRIYRPPTPREKALDQVDAWREAPGVAFLGEGDGYWERLKELVVAGAPLGSQVHDARVAALCRHHGVTALCTADRDFSRYPGVVVRNPLVGPGA